MKKHPNTLHISLPSYAATILSTLHDAQYEAFVVGGFVRDTLRGVQPEENGIDFATSAPPEAVCALFPDSVYENTYGTVIVKIGNNTGEVTTYRSESSYSNHRHPEKVQWGQSIHEDLLRRDFTMNALAWNGKELIDDHQGYEHIHSKMIHTVGNPSERFGEDALRMMRAIRFASQLGFIISPDTLVAIGQNAHTLSHISAERIRDELLKILASPYPDEGIVLLKNTGLLPYVLPELLPAFLCDQKSPNRHHIYDAGTHMVKALGALKNSNPIVRLATLIHDIGKPSTRTVRAGTVTFYNHEIVGTDIAFSIARRLRLSKKETVQLTKLVRYHQFTVDEKQTDSAIRRLIRNVGVENVQDLIDLRFADRIGSGSKPDSWRFQRYRERVIAVQKQPFSVTDLAIDGNDIMKRCSLTPGRKIGELLSALFDKVQEGKIPNNREDLFAALDTLTHSK